MPSQQSLRAALTDGEWRYPLLAGLVGLSGVVGALGAVLGDWLAAKTGPERPAVAD